jgi:hypothetical protein
MKITSELTVKVLQKILKIVKNIEEKEIIIGERENKRVGFKISDS